MHTQGRIPKINDFVLKDAQDKPTAMQGCKLPPCLRASGILHALYSLTEIFSQKTKLKYSVKLQCLRI